MSRIAGSPAGIPLPGPGSREFLDTATAEGLLARRGVPSQAPAGHQALGRLLQTAASPASERELADQAAAVAAFVLTTTARKSTRRRQGLAAGIAAAAMLAAGGSAAAGILPAPVQELAHRAFDAPAPQHASPLPGSTPHAPRHGQPASGRAATPGHGRGHAHGTTKAHGKGPKPKPPGKPEGKKPPGKAKGHLKQETTGSPNGNGKAGNQPRRPEGPARPTR
jgi:hypothetical protein